MRTTSIAARITGTVVAGLAVAAFIGTGAAQAGGQPIVQPVAQAGPQNCTVHWDAFSATANCDDTGAPAGREYALIVDCWGLHGIPNAFPLYAVGPYSQTSRSFGPTGQATGGCSTNWGAPTLNAGVITNAHVEIYRQ